MQAQNVFDIIALSSELRQTAERMTGDVNEACLLVHQVVAKALAAPRKADAEAMRRDLAVLARAPIN